ncbi:clathrin interactor 1 isoform X3 [Aplysia californica]|uniref:Clathrin interactor 1 isoform X3 n=1 Tax=Aplysia californica TaxID=6500 RepID=A0ABM1VT82_APLCA|nr:clathrin interactor 1 isoform X3 [Aplysia californica]
MLSAGVWKLRELTDKVTNVVMNYSEVETKVREATNDDAWGPHGSLMKEIAQYTFTYEHFPEVMGMLWKRMLHDNKKNWRRVYKALVLLSYLIKNGSERVVTSTREHIYDLRGLENYAFTDELGKDQGLNVRHKVKELLDFIQDDDRLRDERKKAKKTKDKYVGVSSDVMGFSGTSSYSDRYDEEPKSYRDRPGKMEEIEDWETGKKSVVSGALDKAKDLWNRAQGRHAPDDMYDYDGDRYDDDYERKEKERENRERRDRDRYDFKDDDEEYTSVERTHTTKTEKITTNRRSRSVGKKLDLGASSNFGKEGDTQSQTSSTQADNAPNLFDLGEPSGGQESFADFSNFQSASGGDDFNPRGNSSGGDFGDFAQFGTAAAADTSSPSSGFADFSQFSSASTTSPSSALPVPAAPLAPSTSASSSAANDLFEVFASPNTPTLTPMQPAGNTMQQPTNLMQGSNPMMGNNMNPMMGSTPASGSMGMMSGSNMTGMNSNMGMGMPQGSMGMQGTMMPGMVPMSGMMQQPMMMPTQQQNTMMNPAMMGMGVGLSPSMQVKTEASVTQGQSSIQSVSSTGESSKKNNTWTDSSAKVNISLEGLTPVGSKFQKQNSQTPSLNQIQGTGMGTGMGMMSPGMSGLNQGMSNMSLQSPTAGQPVMGAMPVMGSGPRPMMNNMGMGMNQGNMMGGPQGMGMQMSMSSNMSGNASFQHRTDTAFSTFGNVKQ